jgi:hypothetical protein
MNYTNYDRHTNVLSWTRKIQLSLIPSPFPFPFDPSTAFPRLHPASRAPEPKTNAPNIGRVALPFGTRVIVALLVSTVP